MTHKAGRALHPLQFYELDVFPPLIIISTIEVTEV